MGRPRLLSVLNELLLRLRVGLRVVMRCGKGKRKESGPSSEYGRGAVGKLNDYACGVSRRLKCQIDWASQDNIGLQTILQYALHSGTFQVPAPSRFARGVPHSPRRADCLNNKKWNDIKTFVPNNISTRYPQIYVKNIHPYYIKNNPDIKTFR